MNDKIIVCKNCENHKEFTFWGEYDFQTEEERSYVQCRNCHENMKITSEQEQEFYANAEEVPAGDSFYHRLKE